MTENLPIEKIAFHEAGHAVMGLLLDRRLQYVTIVPDPKKGLGHTQFEEEETDYLPIYKFDRDGREITEEEAAKMEFGRAQPVVHLLSQARHNVEMEILGLMAGGVAVDYRFECESKRGCRPVCGWVARGNPKNPVDDMGRVRALGQRVCGTQQSLEQHILDKLEVAIDLLTLPPHWRAVEAMAAALLRNLTLDEEQARRIFNAAMYPEDLGPRLKDIEDRGE